MHGKRKENVNIVILLPQMDKVGTNGASSSWKLQPWEMFDIFNFRNAFRAEAIIRLFLPRNIVHLFRGILKLRGYKVTRLQGLHFLVGYKFCNPCNFCNFFSWPGPKKLILKVKSYKYLVIEFFKSYKFFKKWKCQEMENLTDLSLIPTI